MSRTVAIGAVVAFGCGGGDVPADAGEASGTDGGSVMRDADRRVDAATDEGDVDAGADGGAHPADGGDPAGDGGPEGGGIEGEVLLRVTFDDTPVGDYSRDALEEDWSGVAWASGLERVDVIEGAEAHDGHSIRVFYPEDGLGHDGGAQWRVELHRSWDELYLAYWVRFGDGFDPVKGGKLPGLVGGEANTGGDKPDGTDGWSARMMWRRELEAVQYVYHPDQPSIYGEDFEWDEGGARHFTAGEWHRVEHRIVMNTPGEHDGVVQGWFDGELALDRQNVRFRDVDSFAIDALYFSTFFGGGDSSWAPTKDEHVYFDDFVIATGPITH